MTPPDRVTVTVSTITRPDGEIEQRSTLISAEGHVSELSAQVFKTQEAEVRRSLMLLGWTPPHGISVGVDTGPEGGVSVCVVRKASDNGRTEVVFSETYKGADHV